MDRTFILRTEIQCRQLYAFLRANWSDMAAAGRPLAVIVSEAKARRSGAQNRRYWALLNEIAEHAWVGGKRYEADVWHAEFAGRFIGWSETPSGTRVPISTTTLSVAQFSEYMDQVEAYATTELGVEIGVTT